MILLQLILVKGTLSIAYVPKRSKLSFHYIFFSSILALGTIAPHDNSG